MTFARVTVTEPATLFILPMAGSLTNGVCKRCPCGDGLAEQSARSVKGTFVRSPPSSKDPLANFHLPSRSYRARKLAHPLIGLRGATLFRGSEWPASEGHNALPGLRLQDHRKQRVKRPVPPPVPLRYPVSTGGVAMRMMKDAQRPTRAETPPVRIEAWLREARGWRGPAHRRFATRKGLPRSISFDILTPCFL